MITHDAPMKWYFAGGKYARLEIGVQLMLANERKDILDVDSVCFHICPSVHSPAMDEHIIEVNGCEVSHRSQEICQISVECSRGIA